jgi:hypothetical protein
MDPALSVTRVHQVESEILVLHKNHTANLSAKISGRTVLMAMIIQRLGGSYQEIAGNARRTKIQNGENVNQRR